MSDTLVVNEIFFSIQGESSFAGRPCVFVRLAGCNLRCGWCDTAYAHGDGRPMTLDAILDEVKAKGGGCPLVELTGGEPLVQPAAPALLARLADLGLTVLLETNGSIDIGNVDPRVTRIVDIKCPGSGQADRNLWANLERLTARDEVKFVLAGRADYDWAVEVIGRHGLAARCLILFSPVLGKLSPADLAGWILADRLPVRFQLQLHKFIWPPDARGV